MTEITLSIKTIISNVAPQTSLLKLLDLDAFKSSREESYTNFVIIGIYVNDFLIASNSTKSM